ncbi:MAG TPA: glycosyltransferase family 39 protein [Actinomycetota bacterium]|nr:glycosyltransferase family 39 protein [Actinomycetota bacterium]
MSSVRDDPAMPLYYFLLHLWLHLGDGEAFIRSLSLIFFVASVPLIYAVASRLAGTRVALVATVLLTLNQNAVHRAQEARGYSLTLFLVILATYLAIRLIEASGRRVLIAYVATALLAVTSHAFALFAVSAHSVVFIVARRHRVPWRTVGMIVGVIITTGLLLWFGPLGEAVRKHRFSWIAQVPASRVLIPIGVLTGQGSGRFPIPYLIVSGVGVIALALRLRNKDERWKAAVPLAWLLVPLIGSFTASFFYPMFFARYLVVVVPALIIVAAIGVTTIKPSFAAIAVSLVIIFIATQSLNAEYRETKNEEWRAATRSILARAEPGDEIIFFHPNGANPYAYYVENADATSRAPRMLWPLNDPKTGGFVRPPIESIPNKLEYAKGRLWLVNAYDSLDERAQILTDDIRQAIVARYELEDFQIFRGGIRVSLFERAT